MAENPSPGGRRKHRWLRVLIGLVVIVLIVAALLPTLVSWLGKSSIERAVNNRINGSASIASLRLGWLGGQRVEGLRVTDQNGDPVAELDVQIDQGLLGLLASRSAPVDVMLAGSVHAKVLDDGSLNFSRLAKSEPGHVGAKPPEPSAQPSGPFQLPDLPPINVNVNAIDFRLDNLKTGDVLTLDNLAGTIAYGGAAQPIIVDLKGKTAAKQTPGEVAVKGRLENAFNNSGALTLRGATAKLDLAASGIPLPVEVPFAPGSANVQSLAVNVISDDLTSRIAATVRAAVAMGQGEPTTLQADAVVTDLLTTAGQLTMRGASANVTAILANLPVRTDEVSGDITGLTATISSADLTGEVKFGAEGEAQLEGHPPSSLSANLAVAELFKPDGAVSFAIDRATGTVRGKAIPTPVLEPFLQQTPIVATRDVGPTVDVQADFTGGAAREVSLRAVGDNIRLEVAGEFLPDRSVTGHTLVLVAPAADPQLVANLANLKVDRPVDLAIELSSFSLAADAAGGYPLEGVAATGKATINGPVVADLGSPDAPRPIEIANAIVDFESTGLGDHLTVRGIAKIDGAPVAIDQRITGLLDANGDLALLAADPVGTLSVSDLPAATVAKFTAPEQRTLLHQLVGPGLDTVITTSMEGDDLRAVATAQAAGLNASFTALRKPRVIAIEQGSVTIRATPEIVEAARPQADEQSITLVGETNARIELQPFELARPTPATIAMSEQPIRARITVDRAVLDHVPSLAEPLGVAELNSDLEARRMGSDLTIAAKGGVVLRRVSIDRPLTRATFDATVVQREDQLTPTAELTLHRISMKHLEAMLGKAPDAIAAWTGDTGDIALNLSGGAGLYRATIRPALPNLAGEFEAQTDGEMMSLAAKTSTLTLSKEGLEQRLNAKSGAAQDQSDEEPADESEAGEAAQPIRVLEDVPMQLAIDQLRFPLAMLQDEPFDPTLVDLKMALSGGPLKLLNPGGVTTSLADLRVNLQSDDLTNGIGFSLTASADADAPPDLGVAGESGAPGTPPAAITQEDSSMRLARELQAGTLDVTGTLQSLMTPEGRLAPLAKATLQMNAKANTVPTAIADAFAGMQGLLVAAVGPQMNAAFVADDFSTNSGQIEGRIETTNGWTQLLMRGKLNALRTPKNRPVKAELAITPPLRQRLLEKIHPILADVRTTEQPLRATVDNLIMPSDGRISRLNADIQITIGKVEFDSGSTTLKLLALFNKPDRATIPGEIEPIVATIRKGVVNYEKFSVHIGKYRLDYFGEINLVKQTVDLTTEIPLEALAQTFDELSGYADKITVPLVTRGKFGALKTQVDPKFDLGKAALKAGFRGGLEELLKGQEGKPGLLDELFKDIAKPKDEKPDPAN